MSVGEEVSGAGLEAIAVGPAREKADTSSDLLPPRFPLIDLTIGGEPVAAPRPQVTVNQHVYYRGHYRERRDAIAMLMKSARRRKEPCTGLVHLEVRFHRGTRRRADADNLLKPVMDAGNGVLWADDSQIVSGSWDIDWGMPPRTEVRAWVIGGW